MVLEKPTGILLMGGKSSRMKQDKALIKYEGIMLAEWSCQLLNEFCNNILVSSNNKVHIIFGNRLVNDEIGEGPIAGLFAGLKASKTDWNLVLPCDTPKLKKDIILRLFQNIGDVDAVVAVDANKRVHPLIGYYHKRIIPVIKEEIINNHLSMMNLLDKINVKQVVFSFDDAFKNMNEIDDLKC